LDCHYSSVNYDVIVRKHGRMLRSFGLSQYSNMCFLYLDLIE
jgi:hypothetical protein